MAARAQTLRDWRDRAGEMVDKEIAAAGVTNERVIGAMRDTPRHEFVPKNQQQFAYLDMALPIGAGQTISLGGGSLMVFFGFNVTIKGDT